MKNSITKQALHHGTDKKQGLLFKVFCLWLFVLLCRPQDIFSPLAVLRPALLTGFGTLVLVIFQYRYLTEHSFFKELQVRYYTALILIMIVGIPFSLYPGLSFKTIFTEQINVILFFFIFYKVVVSVNQLHTVILLGCLGNGLYSVFSLVTGTMVSGRLFFGGMFDPNDLAFFALAFVPFNLLFISRRSSLLVRLACLGSLGVGVLLILLTGSRGGLVAMGIVAAGFLLCKTHVVKFSGKVLFVGLMLIVVSNASVNFDRYLTLLDVGQDYNMQSETGRIAIWTIGMKAMLSHPITGVGVRCFPHAVGLDRESRGLENARWQTAHNSVVLIGTETGVVGLVLYLLMSLNVFRIFRKVKKESVSEKMVKICETGQFGFVGLFVSSLFLSQAYSFYWAFYVAMSAVIHQLARRETIPEMITIRK